MNRPLRICHLGKYYDPIVGGIETQLKNLVETESNAGHHVEVICFQHPGRTTSIDYDRKVRITRVGRLARIASLDISPEIVDILRKVDADVFHIHVPNPTMIAAMLFSGRYLDTPMIVTYHSDHVAQPIRGAFFRPLEHLFYQRVSGIAVTSLDYINASSLLSTYKRKTKVIPLGINVTPFASPSEKDYQQAQQIKARFDGPIWLACGRLVSYKGLDTAVRAIFQLPGTLLIVGDGPERDNLQRLAKDFRVRNQVVFMGQTPGVIPYYHAAHALWLTSNARNEAFGLVQVEAMASGCPVINPLIPGSGCHRVSLNEITGLTVPHSDPDALVTASRKLMDRNKWAVFSENAKKRAAKEFNNEKRLERYLQLYYEVTQREEEEVTTKWAVNS